MASTKLVGVCTMRITRLEADGTPVAGAPQGGLIICDGITSITFDKEIKEGTEIEQEDSCGKLCVSGKRPDQTKWVNVEIGFCGSSKQQREIMGNEALIFDGLNPVGNGILAGGGCGTAPATPYVAIEAWAENWECDGPDPTAPWKRLIFPRATGIFTPGAVDGSAASWTWTGRSFSNPNFGTGAFADITPGVDPAHAFEDRDNVDADVPVCVGNSYDYIPTP